MPRVSASRPARSAGPIFSRLLRLARAEFIIPAMAIIALAGIASPHASRANDDRLSILSAQASRLQEAIDLYRARAGTGRFPDLLASGWRDMIDAGFLNASPVNAMTGSSLISRYASASAGWRFDPVTGRLSACVVDPTTGEARLLSN